MKKIFLNIFLFIACTGCGGANDSPNIEIQNPKLSKNIYDSIQVFVDANINSNSHSEIYLLEFLSRRFDSIDYRLTTIHPKAIPEKYKNSLCFYNKDSSLLIVDDYYASLYVNPCFNNYLHKISRIEFSTDTGSVVFNPLVWRLTVLDKQVFIDRSYGIQDAEKNLKIPEKKFTPY